MNFKQRLSLISCLISTSLLVATCLAELGIIHNWTDPGWPFYLIVFFMAFAWLKLDKHYSQKNKLLIEEFNKKAWEAMSEENTQIEEQNKAKFGENYDEAMSDMENAYSNNSGEAYREACKILQAMQVPRTEPAKLKAYHYWWFWPWFILSLIIWYFYSKTLMGF